MNDPRRGEGCSPMKALAVVGDFDWIGVGGSVWVGEGGCACDKP